MGISIRTWNLNEKQKPIMNTRYLILTLSLMLLGIGALPQNVAEPSAERQDEAPPGAEDVAKAEVADAVDAERQDDIGEAPPMPPGAKDIVEAEDDEEMPEEDEEIEDPDPTDEELEEDEDPEWDETEDDEDESKDESSEDKEEEVAAPAAEEDAKEASDKLEEPVAPVAEVKAEA